MSEAAFEDLRGRLERELGRPLVTRGEVFEAFKAATGTTGAVADEMFAMETGVTDTPIVDRGVSGPDPDDNLFA